MLLFAVIIVILLGATACIVFSLVVIQGILHRLLGIFDATVETIYDAEECNTNEDNKDGGEYQYAKESFRHRLFLFFREVCQDGK